MNNSAIPLRRLFVSSLAMAVAVGCAPTIQQPHSTVLGALDPLNRQGTLGLAVAGGEIEPTYWRLETNRGQAAKDGFADTVGDGAGTGAAPGLFISAICLPCAIIGLPLALGGAVVGSLVGGAAGAAEGSANAATQSSSMPISQLAGADQLLHSALQDQPLEEHLRAKVHTLMSQGSGYAAHIVPAGQTITKPFLERDKFGEVMQLRVYDFGFAGESEEDPNVALIIKAEVNSFSAGKEFARERKLGHWIYGGKPRRMSAWRENQATVFREELDRAITWLADEIVSALVIVDPEDQYRRGLKQTGGRAERWFCLAAHGGHGGAQHQMAKRAESSSDLIQAFKWYELAALNGHPPGELSWHQLKQRMSDGQIEKAKRLAAVWQPEQAACAAIGTPDPKWRELSLAESP